MAGEPDTTARLEAVTGENWREFLASDRAVLVLGKTDCANCARWSEELSAWLADEQSWTGVRFGKMMLDTRGLTEFKKENRWLADVDSLPFNVLYDHGERKSEWAGGGVQRLENRLSRLFGDG